MRLTTIERMTRNPTKVGEVGADNNKYAVVPELQNVLEACASYVDPGKCRSYTILILIR